MIYVLDFVTYMFAFGCFGLCLPRASITTASRRNQHRQRSRAQLAWYLHKRGIKRLQVAQLTDLTLRLSAHHSRDYQLLRSIRKEMANAHSETQGWFCGTCRKMRSPQEHYCDLIRPPKSRCTMPSTTWIAHGLRWRKPSRPGPISWPIGEPSSLRLYWREYTEHFQKQEQTCQEEIAQA